MANRAPVIGQMGLFVPPTTWEAPTELPDLRNRKIIALDTENNDQGLSKNMGPGWALGAAGGWIAGVSWAAEGSAGYAPVRHPDTACMDWDVVRRWIEDHARAGVQFVFHNSGYDFGWLGTAGCDTTQFQFEDTMCAAVMIDETLRTYNLDVVAKRAGVPGKDSELLREAVRAYGGDYRKPAAEVWRLPARYGGPYAEADAVATLALWQQQEGVLRAQEVHDAYRVEMDLVPMIVAMRRRGIRLDAARAAQVGRQFRAQRDAALARMTRELGPAQRRAVTMEDVRSPKWLEARFTEEKIAFPRTVKTQQGSFQSEWMAKSDKWLPRLVADAVKFEDAATKFIDNYLLSYAHRGRLHAEVHQFLSDEGGTRSQRFSYANPPLQQMPSPDKDPRGDDPALPPGNRKGAVLEDRAVGTLIRSCFLPEPGELWGSCDFSSQEPRITVHFAAACKAQGAEIAVQRYNENPRLDYHQFVADITGLPRPRAKIINLAVTYGKGVNSLAEEMGISVDEAKEILKTYHTEMPYAKSLEDICKRRAAARGYIRLIDGARMRYTSWEGGWVDYEVRLAAERAGHKMTPCSHEEALERQANPDHPWSRTRLRRADTRKALNNLVQGSAARQTKIAMRDMWREGVTPLLQMHDEVAHSCGTARQKRIVEEIMVNAVRLKVPVVVDHEFGDSWGTAKNSWEAAVTKYGVGA